MKQSFYRANPDGSFEWKGTTGYGKGCLKLKDQLQERLSVDLSDAVETEDINVVTDEHVQEG